MSEIIRFNIPTAAPTDSDTTTLFNSVTAYGAGVLSLTGINRIAFTVENSHSGTLKQYRSTNGGTTWDQVGTDLAVVAAAATDVSGPYDYLVDPHPDWKLDWVNGGTTQTTWRPSLIGIVGDRAKGT